MNIASSPFSAKQKGNNSKTFEFHACRAPNSNSKPPYDIIGYNVNK